MKLLGGCLAVYEMGGVRFPYEAPFLVSISGRSSNWKDNGPANRESGFESRPLHRSSSFAPMVKRQPQLVESQPPSWLGGSTPPRCTAARNAALEWGS